MFFPPGPRSARRLSRCIALFAFFAARLLAGCGSPPAPATLRVEATDLAAPLLSDLTAAYGQANPKVTFVTSVVSPSIMSADLAAGRADLGLAVTHDPGQFATPLGYVSFVVIVHPANPIARLGLAQVRAIFAGRVTDWGQVGGVPVAPLPGSSTGGEILVVSREDNSDAATGFETSALLGAPPTLSALVAPTWAAMREAVSQNPNAIGYLIAPERAATVKAVEIDAELRALVVATAAREPAGSAREFLAWAQRNMRPK